MTNKLKTICVIVFTLLCFNTSAFACSCIYGIETNNLTGQIFAVQHLGTKFKPEPNYEKPIAKARIVLTQRDETQKNEYKYKLISEVFADESGRFSLENIKPGKYVFNVYASGYEGVSASLTFSESSNRKPDKIEIALPPPFSCCGASVRVKKTEKTSRYERKRPTNQWT
jgi:hypothetical protein